MPKKNPRQAKPPGKLWTISKKSSKKIQNEAMLRESMRRRDQGTHRSPSKTKGARAKGATDQRRKEIKHVAEPRDMTALRQIA